MHFTMPPDARMHRPWMGVIILPLLRCSTAAVAPEWLSGSDNTSLTQAPNPSRSVQDEVAELRCAVIYLVRNTMRDVVVDLPLGTCPYACNDATDVIITESVIGQFLKPGLISGISVKDDTSKKIGKCTDDI